MSPVSEPDLQPKYGTVPIVRATAASTIPSNPGTRVSGKGTGFKFPNTTVSPLLLTIKQALVAFRDQTSWQVLMRTAE